MNADGFPDFNADALQNLTKKIQNNLLQTGKPSPNPNSAKPRKAKQDVNTKAKENPKAQVEPKKPKPSKEQRASQPAQPRSHPQVTPPNTAQQNPRNKRLRNGEVKKPASKSDVNTIAINQSRLNEASLPSNEILRGEIKALGGTDEDFELVAGVTSDSEVEGTRGIETDNGLSRELEKVIDRLGIAEARQDDDEEEGEEGEEEEESIVKDSEVRNVQSNSNANKFPINETAPSASSMKSKKDHTLLLFEPLSEWHAAELPLIAHSTDAPALPPDLVQRLHDYAKSLLDAENKAYSTSQRSASSSQRFYSTIMSTGTLSDKIGALTLSVQESPLHNIKALESLLGLARKRSRAQAVEVLGALKDLFAAGNLLPSDRRLKPFAGQPALHAAFESKHEEWTADKPLPRPLKKADLIVWAFEDWLKSLFFQVLTIIETWCNDEVVFARGKAVDYVYSLLKEKPEQEANLLRLLVNKLGDSEKKVASKTSFNILQLETTHPSMKPIIVSAIESDLLFRPGQSFHAQYYAIITLNQTVLSSREGAIAKQLLNIYFALFLRLLEKPKTLKTEDEAPQKATKVSINRKGEIQGGGGAGGKKAAQKAAEKKKSSAAAEDLQEKMLSAVLTGVNRAIPFISANDGSFEKHVDTLFSVTHSSNFNTSIQALMLIQQLQGSNQTTADRFYRTLYESLLDSRLLTSSKQVLYLNLLYRSLRADLDTKRIKAFIKRLLQIISMHQPPFVCGVLYLIRELETTLPSLSSFIDQPEEKPDDDEEEIFRDVPEDPTPPSPGPSNPSNPPSTKSSATPQLPYDGRKRDPLHANAQSSTCWDIHPLLTHYHPSVSLFTSRLLSHSAMPPKPDLSLNTLIHFLDRFVYKNPKSSSSSSGGITRGASLMQPLLATGGSRTDGGVLVTSGGAGRRASGPVNSADFWKRNREEIGADEVFFHRYFSALGMGKEKRAEKKKRKEEKKKKARAGDREDDSEAEAEEEEGEIWKALVGSKPDIEGDVDDVEDDGFDDQDAEAGFSDLDDDDGIHEDAAANTAQLDEDDDDAIFPHFADAASGSDVDALLDSDEEVDLTAAFAAENTPSLTHTDPGGKGKKRKARPHAGREDAGDVKKGSRREKRMKLRNLPTFAGVEEYAQLLGD